MKAIYNLLFAIVFVFVGACQKGPSTKDYLTVLRKPGMENFKGWVVMVMVPDCPWAIKYAHDFEMLGYEYLSKGFRFLIISPGRDFSEDDYRRFLDDADHTDTIYRDPDFFFAKRLKATISPEFFVVDHWGEVRYSGAFDNRVMELGKAKFKATESYLKSALDDIIAGKEVKRKKTKAVGCYLEIP
jgi:hypothetical protein